ncbi:hypothetical protein TgHK011_004596 [Trichoderma gracile]|nr:hypothetical protein TgHK011_004596 [Trichoderma gracile]
MDQRQLAARAQFRAPCFSCSRARILVHTSTNITTSSILSGAAASLLTSQAGLTNRSPPLPGSRPLHKYIRASRPQRLAERQNDLWGTHIYCHLKAQGGASAPNFACTTKDKKVLFSLTAAQSGFLMNFGSSSSPCLNSFTTGHPSCAPFDSPPCASCVVSESLLA